MTAPAPAAHTHTRTFSGDRASVADARHWLEDLLARTCDPKIPGETVAAAALLLSEAASNAVRHTQTGYRPGGVFTVGLRIAEDGITVQVEDDGGGASTVPASGPDIDADDNGGESGRGLLLIDAFADDWGPVRGGCGLYYTLNRHEPLAVRP